MASEAKKRKARPIASFKLFSFQEKMLMAMQKKVLKPNPVASETEERDRDFNVLSRVGLGTIYSCVSYDENKLDWRRDGF